ncbi:MAG: acylphosphatase [Methanothrix sp.]
MKRLTATVSGKVQKVGYRKRIIDIASAFGIKGIVENLEDGRVKIVAEGDDEKLKWFENAIEIKNTLIQVDSVEKDYSPARGEFAGFGKIVAGDETDSRLDKGIDVMNKMLVAIIDVKTTIVDMNSNLGGKMDALGGKMDVLGDKIDVVGNKVDALGGKMDVLGDKIDVVGDKVDSLGGKMDLMIQKQDELIVEVKDMSQNQNEILVEVKDLNKKIGGDQENEIFEMRNDIAEIKSALKAKGII